MLLSPLDKIILGISQSHNFVAFFFFFLNLSVEFFCQILNSKNYFLRINFSSFYIRASILKILVKIDYELRNLEGEVMFIDLNFKNQILIKRSGNNHEYGFKKT